MSNMFSRHDMQLCCMFIVKGEFFRGSKILARRYSCSLALKRCLFRSFCLCLYEEEEEEEFILQTCIQNFQ